MYLSNSGSHRDRRPFASGRSDNQNRKEPRSRHYVYIGAIVFSAIFFFFLFFRTGKRGVASPEGVFREYLVERGLPKNWMPDFKLLRWGKKALRNNCSPVGSQTLLYGTVLVEATSWGFRGLAIAPRRPLRVYLCEACMLLVYLRQRVRIRRRGLS